MWRVGLFGGIVGSGPGAGMALMMVVSGLLGTGVALAGYLVPAVRDAELLLPDHDAPTSPAPSAEAQDELEPQPAGVS